MTEIAFHVNTPDKLAYACRLLRKALRQGSRVVVTGSEELLQRLDIALWTFSATDFVAHCQATASESVRLASPIVLAANPASAPLAPVLVNLGPDLPMGFERFDRVIELADHSDGDRLQARIRWKHYANRGYALKHQDISKMEEARS